MTTQIITPNLFKGLSVTTGLSFGQGLILGYGTFSGIFFAGGGSLTVSTLETIREAAVFNGAGNLSALPSGRYLTNPATFAGGGSLSDTANIIDYVFKGAGSFTASALLGAAAYANLNGSGSLVGSALLGIAALVSFAGVGGLTLTTRETIQEAATFAGTGGLAPTVFGALKNNPATFAGAGSLSVMVSS